MIVLTRYWIPPWLWNEVDALTVKKSINGSVAPKQWAAVSAQSLDKTDAPHIWLLKYCKDN